MKARLVAILAVICPRIYLHGTAPTSTVRPYITYYPIAGKSVNYTDDAIPDVQNSVMQISVWADRETEASDLTQQIEDAIRTASTLQGRPLSAPIISYEPGPPKLCGSIQRFDIWATR